MVGVVGVAKMGERLVRGVHFGVVVVAGIVGRLGWETESLHLGIWSPRDRRAACFLTLLMLTDADVYGLICLDWCKNKQIK